jgi:glucokinase
MHSILLGDIGGTHSRFAIGDDSGQPSEVREYTDDDFISLGAAIAQYLQDVGARPDEAVLGVAAPVRGRQVTLTNRGWRFDLDDLAQRFGLTRIQAVNDFEAQAWALTRLRPSDLRRIGTVGEAPPGPQVVLGPGTGLGVAALLPGPHGPTAIATEAGHISFGPAAADEDAVFARIRQVGPVTAETVLSGPGVERLYRALHPGAVPLTAAQLVEGAQSGEAQPLAATQMFLRLLGRFAGDMALVFGASGGAYITGGVAQGLGEAFDAGIFRAAFEAHPPYVDMLAKTPTFLITHPQPGLLGCAALAQHRRE